MFLPKRVLYKKDSENYELGKYLLELYKSNNIPCDIIENHNNIEEMRNKEKMTGRGRGKYMYKSEYRAAGELFFIEKLKKYFPNNEIKYIV